MAAWMKLWIGLTLTGLALVAAFLLPPAPPSVRLTQNDGPNPIEQQTRQLRSEVDVRLAAIQRIRWSDSLSQLTVAQTDGFALGYPDRDEVEAQVLSDHEQWVANEIMELDRRHPDMAFGYFNQAADFGAEIPARLRNSQGSRGKEETYVGTLNGQPYCMQVRAVSPSGFAADFNRRMATLRAVREDSRAGGTDYLGLCRPYVRFGLAGSRIQEWLDAGAYAFALRHVENRQGTTRTGDGVVVSEELLYLRPPVRFYPFGLGNRAIGNPAIVEPDQCAVGDVDACRAAVTEPHLMAPSPSRLAAMSPMNDPGDNNAWTTPFRYLDDYLLDDLEADFGADAFAEFWTSQDDVPTAFQDAFGMEMGAWVSRWIQQRTTSHTPGPKLPRFDLLLSFAAVSLFGLWATAWSSRRRVT